MTNEAQREVAALPNTDYFELDSTAVGARFAVWVTRPLAYDALPDANFPILYVTDGNIATALTAPYAVLYGADFITPVNPYLQVSIGYAGVSVMEANVIRNRDLLPPDEPVPAHVTALFEAAVAGGAMTRAQYEDIMAVLRDPHGERFLDFIENELHAAVSERYRVRPGRHGLFGYSYGGLFSLYALVRQSPLFDRIGAGSPGIFETDSQIFTLLGQLAGRGATFDDVRLCLTVNELELTGPAPAYRLLGRAFTNFVEKLRQNDFGGLKVFTRIIGEESHVSGLTASYLTFVRNCYGAAGEG